MPGVTSSPRDADVLVIGAGPGGTTTATFLAQGGLRVALVEREAFPRFKVGESLIPTCMDICKRLGVLDRVLGHGFQLKYGATFHDQELDLETTFDFRPGRPWPSFTLDVHRAEFDQILLEHAVSHPGVTLHQPATVEKVAFDADGVTARLSDREGERELRASFVVDASGRDAFLAARQGQRKPRPGLGKVAIYAYFRGARRFPGRSEGNVRLYIFPEGWFWYIPLARNETSVGCVLHQRVVKARRGTLQQLFDEMVERCAKISENLQGAERVTELYTTSNFAYTIEPIIGDRFLCVGDAVAFVDPIFSPGVFLAMQTGELAAGAIQRAFRTGRLEARRFRGYERAVRRGTKPFERFIESYYDRAFLEVFMRPKNVLGVIPAVTGVLAGGSFGLLPKHLHASLWFFHQVVRLTRWANLRRGVVLESRLDW
jgi:2-polyprenyl-6-methoxyphenol hydroxylase-like FAD-dependent oxidoreductase